jgi:hypothetical protein
VVWSTFDKRAGYEDGQLRNEALRRVYGLYRGNAKMIQFVTGLQSLHVPSGCGYAWLVENWDEFATMFNKLLDDIDAGKQQQDPPKEKKPERRLGKIF